jgi:hypothetical protein
MTTSPDDKSRNTEPETTVAGDVPCQPVAAIIFAPTGKLVPSRSVRCARTAPLSALGST